METKPFSLQSPEQIAKDYGGNKQKIAEAMQMGILDPTAGTLAGMFIDRMRSAAQMEGAPQQSIAQQVFAPPQPQMPQMPMGAPPAPMAPAGLGATPEAAAMPAPEMAMPGMAMGGMIPPYASGGLTALPVPDDMFDEPSNGSFAGGGLVAFARGDLIDESEEDANRQAEKAEEAKTGDIVALNAKEETPATKVLGGTTFATPDSLFGGFKENLFGGYNILDELSPRVTKRAEQYQAYLDRVLDPQEQAARAKDSFMASIGKLGARMAATPGSLLQAFNAGAAEAIPDMEAGAEARRAEENAIVKELASEERTGNAELEGRFNAAVDMMIKGFLPIEKSFQDRNFQNMLDRLGINAEILKARIMADATKFSATESKEASMYGSRQELGARRAALFSSFLDDAKKNSAFDPVFQRLYEKNPNTAAVYLQNLARQQVNDTLGGMDDYGSPPPGAVTRTK